MRNEQIAYERGYRITKDGQLLNPEGKKIGYISNLGYERTTIRINGENIRIRTHRLQAYQKYGDKLFQDGIVVRHLNGNKLDNSFDNIAIGTYRDNTMDIPKKTRQKRVMKGITKQIKYDKEFVTKLREDYELVKNYNELGRIYNMHSAKIWRLINKRKVFKDA